MANRWLVSLCLAAPLVAQQGRVDGPIAGYAFDSSAQVLRPVLGVPGAAVLGDAVSLGAGASSAWVSPGLDAALAVAADGSVHLFALNSGTSSEVALNGVTPGPSRVVFSPSGTAAALYGGGRIQVLTGIPAAPQPGNSFDLAAMLALPERGHEPLKGPFAVSDDGAYVLVAAGAGVQLLGAGGPRQILDGRNAQVAFARGSHDAVIAGAGVTLIKDVGGAAQQQTIAAAGASPAAVGIAFSSDNSKVYVASAAAQGVTGYDLAAGTSQTLACGCTPAGIVPMGSLYRLTEIAAAPLWLLDTTATGPRIVFVPQKAAE